jgi:hypothetical protein
MLCGPVSSNISFDETLRLRFECFRQDPHPSTVRPVLEPPGPKCRECQ